MVARPRPILRPLLAVALGALTYALACLAFEPAGALAAAARPTPSVSANWAGYVAVLSAKGGSSRFSAVAGSWTEPAVSCTAGRESFSAAWVGLGGYREDARSLEQIGSDADCAKSGQALYSLWYELLPAAPVELELPVHAGDRLEASVSVAGKAVTLRVSDVSTGEHFTSTRHAASVDASSAEWIVEAPSGCASANACSVLPLANFGAVDFSSATASAGHYSGPAVDAHWSASALELEQMGFSGFHREDLVNGTPAHTVTLASPSPSSAPYGSFAVSWHEQTLALERPAPPALPGSGTATGPFA